MSPKKNGHSVGLQLLIRKCSDQGIVCEDRIIEGSRSKVI